MHDYELEKETFVFVMQGVDAKHANETAPKTQYNGFTDYYSSQLSYLP